MAPRPFTESPALQERWQRRAIWSLAVIAPVGVALLLVPGRGHLTSADDALILVVVTVTVASSGRRGAAALAALVSAASFDFFLTRPYESFLISRQADLTTEVLFVVVGLLVGDLATTVNVTDERQQKGVTS